MADKTGIEWTEATWNPLVGCSLKSPGCTNCYAMSMAARIQRMTPGSHYAGTTQESKAGAVWTGLVKLAPDHILTQPLRWSRPRKIFVNSMSDLFHESVPDEWIDRIFAFMALAPQHTFQVLTKRSARMREYMSNPNRSWIIAREFLRMWGAQQFFGKHVITDDNYPLMDGRPDDHPLLRAWPLPNVWLGVSVEDQARADERIPDLLATPAAVRWLSMEPLLGPVDLVHIRCDETYSPDSDPHNDLNALTGNVTNLAVSYSERRERLDWIVVGGESGPKSRPMHPDWARSIRDQCAAAGVPFLFKQWGEWAPVCAMSDDQIDGCYHALPESDPEGTRREKLKSIVLHRDGACFRDAGRYEFGAHMQGSGSMTMFPIGKKRAGRLLDGIEHNGYPA